MVKEAEANKEADKKRREEVDSRNQADSILHEVDKNLKEHGEKISAEDKDKIIKAKEALQESLKGKDAEDIKKKVADLVSASMKLGEAVYKDSQPDQGKGETTTEAPKEDGKKEDIVDADFEEVKKDDKDKK